MRYRVVAIISLVAITAGASVAGAESPKRQARRLFRQAAALHGNGDLAAALEKFQRAQALYPSYKIELNIAALLIGLKRRPEAAELYERFLEQPRAPRRTVARVRRELTTLSAKLGRLRVECALAAATLEVDGAPAGRTPRARWIYLEPGRHAIQACKAGYDCATEQVTLAAGEQRVVTLAPARPAPSPPPVAAAPQPPAPAPTPAPVDEGRHGGWKATAGWIAVGVGAASMVAGTILGGAVSSKNDEHAEAVTDGKTFAELNEIADSGRRYEKAELATLIVGGVGLAAGAGLLFWHYLGGGPKSATEGAFITPRLATTGYGIAGGVRF